MTSWKKNKRREFVTSGNRNIKINTIVIIRQPDITMQGIVVPCLRADNPEMKYSLTVVGVLHNKGHSTNVGHAFLQLSNWDRKILNRQQFCFVNRSKMFIKSLYQRVVLIQPEIICQTKTCFSPAVQKQRMGSLSESRERRWIDEVLN